MQGGMYAGNLFAQVLGDAMGWDVRTYPDGGLERNLQPVSLTTTCGPASDAARTRPLEISAVMVSGEHMIEALPLECVLEPKGMLIVGSVQEPEALWRGLSRRAANWVRAAGSASTCWMRARSPRRWRRTRRSSINSPSGR